MTNTDKGMQTLAEAANAVVEKARILKELNDSQPKPGTAEHLKWQTDMDRAFAEMPED